MKITIELDTANEASGAAAAAVIAKLFPTSPGVQTASPPASTPAATGQTPAAAPAPSAPAAAPAPAASAPPASPTPAPVASGAAPTSPAPAATAPAPAPAAESTMSAATFNAQVQLYAKEHKPAGAKARFAEVAAAFNQPAWTTIAAIPADQYEAVAAWFVPASGAKAA